VTTSYKRNCFFIIHCHTCKVSRISRADKVVRISIRSFRIHKSHLNSC
jgi:hypothetical protein